jgi:hypothetical protein
MGFQAHERRRTIETALAAGFSLFSVLMCLSILLSFKRKNPGLKACHFATGFMGLKAHAPSLTSHRSVANQTSVAADPSTLLRMTNISFKTLYGYGTQ